MSKFSREYFTLFSNTSRYSCAGLLPRVGFMFERDIIAAADAELRRAGETLEDMAGIGYVEGADDIWRPVRELTDAEVLSLSIEKLGDDGRLFMVFETDEAGIKDFIATSGTFSVGDEAREIVNKIVQNAPPAWLAPE